MFNWRYFAAVSVTGLALLATTGCQPERPAVIPPNAQLQDSGNGKVHFTASRDGTVYIYDASLNRLVWSGRIWRDQGVDVDPVRNEVRVGGNVVANNALNPANRYDVYFEQSPAPWPSNVNERSQYYPNTPPAGVYPNNSGTTVTTPGPANVRVEPNPNSDTPPGTVTVQPAR